MGPCVRRDDTEGGATLTYLINAPHIARSLKPERRAVAVVDPFSGKRFRHRLHHRIVAHEQDDGCRMTIEPSADAAQRSFRNRRPRLAIRRQDRNQVFHRPQAVRLHRRRDRRALEAAEVAFEDAVVDVDLLAGRGSDDLGGFQRADERAGDDMVE